MLERLLKASEELTSLTGLDDPFAALRFFGSDTSVLFALAKASLSIDGLCTGFVFVSIPLLVKTRII